MSEPCCCSNERAGYIAGDYLSKQSLDAIRKIVREELSNQFFRELSEDPELTDPEMEIEC